MLHTCADLLMHRVWGDPKDLGGMSASESVFGIIWI
jgi:hypothetical protein